MLHGAKQKNEPRKRALPLPVCIDFYGKGLDLKLPDRRKEIMIAAGIHGSAATPKGLRHGFGVHAFEASVPPHLVRRWLGHASLRTTAVYGDVMGPEERAFAARMWSRSNR